MSRWNHPNQGFKKGHKGFLGREVYEKTSIRMKGNTIVLGKHWKLSKETKENMKLAWQKRKTGKFINCEYCKKSFYIPKGLIGAKRWCSRNCYVKSTKTRPEISGEKSYQWKGGTRKHSAGYIRCIARNHPFAMDKKYVFQHRLVMEKHLGRYLRPEEKIHHRNGLKDDNRLENLEIVGKPHFGKVCCPFCEKEFLIK